MLGRRGRYLPLPGRGSPDCGAENIYVQMEKSMLDAGAAPLQTISTFKLYEVAKYVTLINFYMVPNGNRVMNINSYNKLPPDIKKVFDDNIDWWATPTTRRW